MMGVERQQRAFRRLGERRLVGDHPVEDRLAVLGLARLQERGLGRRLDEVAGRIDQEQAVALALELAGEQEGRARIALRTYVLAVVGHDFAQHPADRAGGIEHGADGEQVARAGLVGKTLGEERDHRLGGGEIARREQDHDPLARPLEHGELAHGRDVVDSGVGAGVGGEHQAAPDQDTDTIGHGLPLQNAGLVAARRRLSKAPRTGLQWCARRAALASAPRQRRRRSRSGKAVAATARRAVR
jgi:hypothetical protein